MPRKYRRYTKEILEPVVSSSISYSQCLDKLGLVKAGGNFSNLQKNIDKFGIDTSHMLHQAHNSGVEFKTFDNLTTNKAIKTRLIKEQGHRCEMCDNTEWLGSPISLELDHINGNNRDNRRKNLRLLCPNCHSTTPTFRNKKRFK